jgi:hypothetical protein
MFKTGNIQSPSERGRRRTSTALLSQSTYTERQNPPLVEETSFLKHVNVLGGNRNLLGVTLSVLTSVQSDIV